MRDLTTEERKMLDLIPQSVFLRYAATRSNEQREYKRNRQCGHAHREPRADCHVCTRAEGLAERNLERILRKFAMDREQLRKLVLDTKKRYSRDDTTDLPGALTIVLDTDRVTASQLLRVFGIR